VYHGEKKYQTTATANTGARPPTMAAASGILLNEGGKIWANG
jgi:hypothetical protein